MNMRRVAIITATGAVVALGGGAAIGATSGDDGKKIEAQILADAAKRLGTTEDKLRDALGAAEDAQLDQAVKDGKLTQAQADAMKKRRAESGHVLGIGPPLHGPDGPHGFGIHIRRGAGPIEDIAKALGVTPRELFSQLRDGKSPADIAKANGKSKADVKAAVTAAAKKRLDAAVKAGKLTQKQADDILAHVDEEFEEHWDQSGFRAGGPGGRDERDHGPPPFGPPPGAPPPMP